MTSSSSPRIAYTAGYLGHTPEELRDACNRVEGFVIDIRMNATSRLPAWRKPGAWFPIVNDGRTTGNSRCALVPELGNRNYYNHKLPIDIYDLNEGLQAIDTLLTWYQEQTGVSASPILLCACRDAATCHRTVVADKLRERGWQVKELEWGGRT